MLENLEAKLHNWFDNCPGAIIALSGGVDSSLVAFLSRNFLGKEKTLAVISASPSLKLRDLDEAKLFCTENDIDLKIIKTKELDDPQYVANPANRCYFCKSNLYEDLVSIAGENWILNGTNADDLGDIRPGLLAATEKNVKSPLVDCGIGKEMVREIAKSYSLRVWNKPASPCMSSRIPYGEMVTVKKLEQIERGEEILREGGFEVSRLRHYGALAKIEVPMDRVNELVVVKDKIVSEIKKVGFMQVEIDMEGFESGKLNRVEVGV